MKISGGSGGWAELQQLPRQLRNELHLLHTGQGKCKVCVRSWGWWLEHRNTELLGEACPAPQDLPQTEQGVKGHPSRDSLESLMLWVVKAAQKLSSVLPFKKGFREGFTG